MSISHSPFPMLVADIGGTNARFAYLTADGTLSDVVAVRCQDFTTPDDAAAHYLQVHLAGADARSVTLAVAAAVPSAGPIKVTNGPWTIDRGAFVSTCGADSIAVYNDFEAIAFLLPHLSPVDYRVIGDTTPTCHTNMVVMGPGTGLGIASAVPLTDQRGAWATVCGEGGHATLAATNAYQAAIIAAAQKTHRHVSAERLVSGMGLPNLYRAVADVEGLAFDAAITADQIGELGSTRRDPLCERTMAVFCAFLGSVAGNVALTVGAQGGVFIAGGIVAKLGQFFFESDFRSQFEAKGRHAEYLRPIGTALLTTPFPALEGLARRALAEGLA